MAYPAQHKRKKAMRAAGRGPDNVERDSANKPNADAIEQMVDEAQKRGSVTPEAYDRRFATLGTRHGPFV